MFMLFRKVLDIDLTSKYSRFRPKNKEFIKRILDKIGKCPYCLGHEITASSFKGFHVTVHCSIDCDICRMCYDDDKHFAYDLNRPEYARNILFDKKEKIRIDFK